VWDTNEPVLALASTRAIEEEFDDEDLLGGTKIVERDARGLLVSDLRLGYDGSVQSDLRFENRYDTAGGIVEKIVTRGDGIHQSRETWTYREDGRKLEWFRYGIDGQLLYSNVFVFSGEFLVTVMATDEVSGRMVDENLTYDSAGRLVRRETNDKIKTTRVEYEHDGLGRVVRTWTYDRDERTFGEQQVYEGDRVVLVQNLSPEGAVTRTRRIAHDDRGRVIEERVEDATGRYVLEVKRTRYETL
jgi:YD repeat-containing protein